MAAEEPSDVAALAAELRVSDFDQFYASTCDRTLALAYSLTYSWADAEDLVQEAYAAAHREWVRVAVMDDPSAWVRKVVSNRAISRWRRHGREVRALTRLAGRRPHTADVATADPEFWAAVATLPARQRQVVAMYYVDDRSVSEIAAAVGCSEGAVKSHLSRARHALSTVLTDPRTGDDHD